MDPDAHRSAGESSFATLAEVVDEVAHLLPAQPPLHAFVHHNTLHAFEHLPFETAVIEASARFGTQPYPSEAAFREHLASGRILPRDLDAVLADDDATGDEEVFPGGPRRRELHALRLRNLFEVPAASAVGWHLHETDLLRTFHRSCGSGARARLLASARDQLGGASRLRGDLVPRTLAAMWRHLAAAASGAPSPARVGVRARDRIRSAGGPDTDTWVHPVLIRLCAGFLDQGVAYWRMPDREVGLLRVFRRLYGLPGPPPDRWMRGLAETLRRQEEENWDAERTLRAALQELRVPADQVHAVLEATLLSLRGWAGMIRHLEERPDRAPIEAPPARLLDYAAVQLTLDAHAAAHAQRVLARAQRRGAARPAGAAQTPNLSLVYEGFLCAQMCGVGPLELSLPANARAWLREVEAFSSEQRRRLLHLAYERRHRVGVLDGLLAHARLAPTVHPRPRFQAIFCIDDREESIRRHLEEILPEVETFGYAGFFGVTMAYQGLEDVRPRPLCPVVVQPTHFIDEVAVEEEEEADFARNRRLHARATHSFGIGSKTLFRGGFVAALLGLGAVLPLIARCLFPRWTERAAHHGAHRLARRPRTRLRIERRPETRADGLRVGYTIDEMATVVESALRTIALTEDFSPVVLVLGHGSSSLNNPHEAAHDCGATGGGRGGPNARAFAAFANEPGVRAALRARGIDIPAQTRFVGGYHNTCDGSLTYYDVESLPAGTIAELEQAQATLAEASRRESHERCRRFDGAPLSIDEERAVEHVEAHAYDLAQPRPEYGHATNAVCIVGRRARTRGLFLDRRAFLVSYDPTTDPSGDILAGVLKAVGPVGAGINLEYYFSFVDNAGYGCGTKLPHNITGLIGVMDGHASDLRTGLPWQMVEIHEPVRLLTIVEAEPATLQRILATAPDLARLIENRWIQVVAWSPTEATFWVFDRGRFVLHTPDSTEIPIVDRSVDFYRGRRGYLGPAHVRAAFGAVEAA